MSVRPVKDCGCGRRYSLAAWRSLRVSYWQDDGVEAVEYRDCLCGNTVGLNADAAWPEIESWVVPAMLRPFVVDCRTALIDARARGTAELRAAWQLISTEPTLARACARLASGLPFLEEES